MALLKEFKTLYVPDLAFRIYPKTLVVFEQAKQLVVLVRLQLERKPGNFRDVSTALSMS